MNVPPKPFPEAASGPSREALLAALAERDRELAEAREREAATAEILEVINSSSGDLAVAFDAIVERSIRLCGADFGGAWIVDGDRIRSNGRGFAPEPFSEYLGRQPFLLVKAFWRLLEDRRFLHVADLSATEAYHNKNPLTVASVELGRIRTLLAAPLRESGVAVGIIVLWREEVRPFTERQVALVQSFAAQAEIAVKNARLMNETKQALERQAATAEILKVVASSPRAAIGIENARLLSDAREALQQQTATAYVLKVISRSAFDLQAVFDTLLGSAVALSGADSGLLCVREGDAFRCKSFVNKSPDLVRFLKENPITPGSGSVMGRVALSGRIESIEDTLADSALSTRNAIRRTNDDRALVGVPLLREGRIEGAIALGRRMPGRFSARAIELVQTFADQAVIAIENVRLFDEVQARTRDLSEALQQQTATADVLKVISRSAFDLQTVFDTLLGSAVELSGADGGALCIRDGDAFRYKSFNNKSPDLVRFLSELPAKPGQETLMGRIAASGQVEWIEDARADSRLNMHGVILRTDDDRALVGVPLLRDGRVEGAIVLTRREPGRFSDRAIELTQTFADQAVIAIENVRLFDEVQARTRDLSEALQQQTATADVLKVISRSAFDLQAVLDTLVQSAQRLCNARGSMIFVRDGEVYRIAAHVGMPEAFVSFRLANPLRADRITAVGRVALTGEMVHLADALADPDIQKAGPQLGDFRAVLSVPLVRENEVVGIFALNRPEPGLFEPGQVKLVQTFADQAAIAIANVRLFNEVKAKTDDLSEALQQQTATADVLKAISRTAFDLDTVLDTLIATAVRLCNANYGQIFRRHGDVYRYAASRMDVDPEYRRHELNAEIKPGRGTLVGRVAMENRAVSVADAWSDPEYEEKDQARLGNVRAMLGVPLMRGGEPIGAFALARSTPIPFTERQIELVTTFADQAVIAIENVRLFDEVQARTRDLSEALQQQTATADVLKVISRSAFDLQAVLDTLVESAYRLSGAAYGLIYLRTGEHFECKSIGGMGAEEGDALFKGRPIRAGRGTAAERVISTGEIQSIPDLFADPEFDPKIKAAIRGAVDSSPAFASLRSLFAVPMKRDDSVVGVIVIARSQIGFLPARQIELLQTFADQAVIAIENARLFDEVQARTRELEESLERQQASAEILRVISASPTDVKPVFDAIALTAGRLFDGQMAAVFRVEGAMLSLATTATRDRLLAEDELPPSVPIDPSENFPSQALAEKRTLYVRDFGAAGISEHERTVSARFGFSSALYMPLLRGEECVGVFLLTAAKTDSFTDKDIALAESFRDQAQIAIGNTRLFHETQEALQQQTATADVLKVISRSAFGLKTVLQTLVDSAVRLCASDGVIYLRDGDVFRAEAAFGANIAGHDPRSRSPRRPGRDSVTGRVALSGRVEQIPDSQVDPEFKVAPAQRMNMRALLGVPLLRDGEVEGVFVLGKPEPGLFSDRTVELVRTFADQAVIAIQNVRLFDAVQAKTHDLEESLQLQTATADVLKVISRSAFDLQAVFDTLIASAVELCGAYSGIICVRDGDIFRYRGSAGEGNNVALAKYLAEHPATPGWGSMAGRVLLSGKVEAIQDRLDDLEFVVPMTSFGLAARALLGVPLLGKSGIEGALVLTRKEPGHFTDRQIEIVQTFADQAVIAIENVRLFEQVQARTRELAASLDDLRKAQNRLVQSEKLASLGQLTAGIAHEIKNPLNFVNNFSALSRELIDELAELLEKAPLQTDQRDEAGELIGTISANLEKVVQHGKRADSIVKNMLLHSREGSGERSRVKVNAMVEEALNLAYHGARAEKPGFNVTIVKSLDPDAGAAELYPQEMTRVLLNLISNGFYATTMRRKGESSGAYEPTITASTRDLGHSVEIVIRDNGAGIPEEVKAKMFNPFFTTKPAGEGTGLGLSLSHDIVVKQHGGTLEVSTEPGAYTQFTIVLQRRGATV